MTGRRAQGCRTPPTTTPRRTVVLGTLGFGTIVDEETSFRILDRFVGGGGTVLDTANN
ncbi:hypothetical protein BX285_1948 [Streptomyces sp. 1114.5]|nr:hypothetical protein BX285_1948 [Streptomyces sp. 1114.5]